MSFYSTNYLWTVFRQLWLTEFWTNFGQFYNSTLKIEMSFFWRQKNCTVVRQNDLNFDLGKNIFGRSVFFRFIHLISFFLSCLHFIFWWKFFFENKMRKRYAGDDDYQPTFAYRRNFGQFFFSFPQAAAKIWRNYWFTIHLIYEILRFYSSFHIKYNCRIDFF